MEEYQKIAYKLEYRFINILEESVMRNIASLLDEQPDWILEKELCDLYNVKEKKKKSFNHNISLIRVYAIELSVLLLFYFF